MTLERLIRWVVSVTATTCTLLFMPSILDPFNLPKLTVLIVGAVTTIPLIAGSWRDLGNARIKWPVLVAIVFVLGISTSALLVDQPAYRTLWGAWARNNGLLAYVSMAVLFIGTVLGFRGDKSRFGLYLIGGAGAVQIAYGSLQYSGLDPIKWNNPYNPILGTLGNPNFASAFLGISAVALFAMACDRQLHWLIRSTMTIGVVIAFTLTILSNSLQGTLAFIAGVAVLILFWLSSHARTGWTKRLLLPYVVTVGGIAALGIAGILGNGPFTSLLASGNIGNRVFYWRAALNMFDRAPILGIGLDSYGDWYRQLRVPEQVEVSGATTVSNAAHNVYLQLASTGGLVTVVPYMVLILMTAAYAWQILLARHTDRERLLAGAIVGMWVAFLLQAFFSIDQLGIAVWGWILAGLVVAHTIPSEVKLAQGKSRRREASQRRGIAVPALAAALSAVGVLVFASGPISTERELKTLLSYDVSTADVTSRSQLVTALVSATKGAPEPYWITSATSRLYSLGAVEEGIDLATKGSARFSRDFTLIELVAQAYEQTDRSKLAVPWRERQMTMDPYNTELADKLARDSAS